MRNSWLKETHGAAFELLRHFLARFFDSDLVTAPGQTAMTFIGTAVMFLTWFPFVTGPIKDKYVHFSALPSPLPYREAIRADELWLIVMTMSIVGLLTAIKWQSLFPSLNDYRAIGSLPVRAGQIFGAKLAALLAVATGTVIVIDFAPCLGFPALSASPYAFDPSLGRRSWALWLAATGACYFLFFALVAIQGALLNLLRAGRFLRITGTLQGLLAGGMLILVLTSFSIGPPVANRLVQPEVAKWLPPVWFLGVCETLSGNPDPAMRALANRAWIGLVTAIVLVLAAYTLSYRRHRALLVEGVSARRTERPWRGALFDWVVPEPHQQAAAKFLAKGLAGTGPQRMLLMAYGGFGVAVLLTSGLAGPTAFFVHAHVILTTFLLIGIRHSFIVPVELKANWVFRIGEGEGRIEWLRAVDRCVLFGGAVLFAVPFPVEAWLLGWRALAEATLTAAFGLLAYEALFASWDKLPFTCSYLPGKRPMWQNALRLMGLLVMFPLAITPFLAALDRWPLFTAVLVTMLAAWVRFRRARRNAWPALRLRYEDTPDPAIHGLNLLK